jgi:hypothetical protein
MATDSYLADRVGATELVGSARAAWLASQIRDKSLLIAAYLTEAVCPHSDSGSERSAKMIASKSPYPGLTPVTS